MRIVCVVDGKIPAVAEMFTFLTENSREDGVKRSHPDVPACFSHKCNDSGFHFAGGFVRKRESKNGFRRNTLVDQIGSAVGKHAGFSAPGSRDNHHGAVECFYRRTLHRIELLKK